MKWWDACVDQSMRPLIGVRSLPVWIGLDASLKRDSTAIVAVTFDREANRARLVWNRIFQPSPDDPIDFESTVERRLLELRGSFDVREVRYDPYQLVAVAQRLSRWLRCGPALTPRATFLPVLLLPIRPSTSRSDGSPASMALAHMAQIGSRNLRADLVGAEEYFVRGIEHFTAAGFRRVPGSVAYTFGVASLNAWALGRADTARERMRQAIAGGSENNSPYEKTWAQSLAAELQIHLREPTEAEAIAEQVVTLSDERGFSQFTGAGRVILGWARANLGYTSEGVALIRQGLKDGAEAGSCVGAGGALTALANAQALDGKIADALATIGKVLQLNQHRPEALNTRGEL